MDSLDSLFELLSRERRRYVLYQLDQAEEPVPVDELTETVAEWEEQSSCEEIDDETLEKVALTLEHQHLPKTDQMEFIEYDREEGVVRVTGSSPELSVILAVTRAIEQPGATDIVDLRNESR